MTAVVSALFAALVAAFGGLTHMQNPAVPTPIGVGPAYTLASGPPTGGPGGCSSGRVAAVSAHVELFARGRALLIPAGVGQGAGCRHRVWTSEPTGVIHIAGQSSTLGRVFAVWGQPLGRHRLAGFASAGPVRVYVDGVLARGRPGSVVLRAHSEVVVELGSYIPPHRFYLFPEGT